MSPDNIITLPARLETIARELAEVDGKNTSVSCRSFTSSFLISKGSARERKRIDIVIPLNVTLSYLITFFFDRTRKQDDNFCNILSLDAKANLKKQH